MTNTELLKDRRVVVLLQLALLLLILTGLFGSFFIQSQQTASVTETIPNPAPPAPAQNEAPPQELKDITIRGKAAHVWDVKNKRTLYAKNEQDVLPLASITKLMTALVAYELAAADTRTKLSDRALAQDGSHGFRSGEDFTLANLQTMSLVSSSNHAAFALGASVGALLGEKDPTAQFVEGMNIRADELGFKTLSFKNTTGLDISPQEAGGYGSAYEVSLLMEYILATYPELIESTTRGGVRIYNSSGEFHDIENTNEALFAIPNLLGSKTGYTDLAGGNLTIAFDAGLNRPIIVTVLGSTRQERFSDVVRLVNAVRANITEL